MSGVVLVTMVSLAMSVADGAPGLSRGGFQWSYGPPVVEARAAGGWDWISVKDPSIVRYGDKWHLFCTVRRPLQFRGMRKAKKPDDGSYD